MRQYFLLSFLIFLPQLIFCQNRSKSLFAAFDRITNKTWQIADSDYYFIPEVVPNSDSKSNLCFGLQHYLYQPNPIDNKIELVYLSCSPYICFTDTTQLKNTFKLLVTSEMGKENAEIIFISDKEFTIYPMQGKKVHFAFLQNGEIEFPK